MEDNRKFELNDDQLDDVAGGSWENEDLSNFGEYVGDVQRCCQTCNGYTGTTEHKLYKNGAQQWAECKTCGRRTKSIVSSNRVVFDINTA